MSGEVQPDPTAPIAASLAAAKPRRRKAKPPPPPPADDGGGGDDPPDWLLYRLPDDCPVTPLGIQDGNFFFMDANDQLRVMHYKDFGSHGLTSLFGAGGGQAWLDLAFPRFGAKGDPIGLDKERAVRTLMAAAARKGVFDADNKVRKPGAWTDDDGRLLWHLGDTVLIRDGERPETYGAVGLIDGMVYPRGAVQPRPLPQDADQQHKAMLELQALYGHWNLRRRETDVRLLLGELGCGMIGGALRWRPATWKTGGAGTGKSTAQDSIVEAVLGGSSASVHAIDITAAGIRQSLDGRTLPIIFDEFEPEDRRKAQQVIQLLTGSSSGGRAVRGGADHQHREHIMRASFLLSSVLVSPLPPAAVTRICMIDFLPQPLGRLAPAIDAARMRDIGRHMRRILADRWRWWPARLAVWLQWFREHHLSNRFADTWGTLLAMADHLLDPRADGVPNADLIDEWCEPLLADLREISTTSASDEARLLNALLTRAVDPFQKGQRWPISSLLSSAAGIEEVHGIERDQATRGLEALGVRVLTSKPPATDEDPDPRPVLAMAVAKDHTELNTLLARDDETRKWAGGVYAQTLARVPGAWSAQQRFAGRDRVRCVMLPLAAALPGAVAKQPGLAGV